MRTSSRLYLLAAGLVAITATTALAGITDSPPPGYKAVWVVPGVINNGNNGTAIICVAHKASTVAVEVFNSAGGAAVGSATGLSLAPGQSATITSQALPNVFGATDLSIGSGFQGSARVSVLSGGKVSCSAYVVSFSGSGAGHALPVVKASGQKGE